MYSPHWRPFLPALRSRESAREPGESHAELIPANSMYTNAGVHPDVFYTKPRKHGRDFYVGGKWVGKPGEEVMHGAIFVEVWVPKKIQHPYPIVFMQGGGGQTFMASIQTPDGRPGWAYNFLNAGYTVYMVSTLRVKAVRLIYLVSTHRWFRLARPH